jgi:conserved phage-related protein|nr:MAG TPA: large terminase [Caudoviricetes sp.]
MTSYKNFSQKKWAQLNWLTNNTDSSLSYDPINQENIDYDEWVKFLSYYRYYIDKFAVDILGINLFPFQRLIMRAMARYPNVMLICCRGLGKRP